MHKPENCIFCSEKESIDHLFFNCIVAKQIWNVVSAFFETEIGTNYNSVARFWVSNKKHAVVNSVCAAVLWCLWKDRNDLVFNGSAWIDIKQVWRRILCSLKRWTLIFKECMRGRVEVFCSHVLQLLRSPLQLENG